MKIDKIVIDFNEEEQTCFQYMRGCYAKEHNTGMLAVVVTSIDITRDTLLLYNEMLALTQNNEELPERIEHTFPAFWDRLKRIMLAFEMRTF